MRVLVLGGNGFIGSHIVDHLLKNGHSVRVFDQTKEKFREPLPTVDYRIASINNIPDLAEALVDIDIVYHLISTTVPSTSNKDPVFDIESNLISTIRLLDLIRDSNVNKIVFLSSGGTVYGIPNHSPIIESHPLKPICSYGVTKIAIENYLHMYHHLYGIDYTILRVSNPYGERQGHTGVQGVISTFIGKIINDDTLEVWGDGSVIRDFIHIDDLASLSVIVSESNETGIFNVGSGIGHSINDIVETLKIASNREIVPNYTSDRSYDVPQVVLNINKIQSQFSWQPKINLLEGIQKTWDWAIQKTIVRK